MAPNSIGAFLFNTVRENRNPEPCLPTLSRFSTWRTTLKSFLSKKRLEKSHDPVDLKIYQVQKKIPSLQNLDLDSFLSRNKRERILKRKGHLAMSRSLLNKRHSLHATRDSKVMIFFTSLQIKHLLEKMCQKSEMDTTIDFVKHYSDK